MPLVKKVTWSYIIDRILWFIRGLCTYASCLREKLKISCSSWYPRHIMLPPWMGAIKMQAIKGMIRPCPCVGTFLVAGNGWPSAKIFEVLCALLATWRQVVQGDPIPNCVQCPTGSIACSFISIETTTEPNRLPKVTNILVFQDHFMKHVMAYMTPEQNTKTVAKFLYQGYIWIFGAPARLLSDCGANCMSNIINEMCKFLGMKKQHTTPYHPKTIGLVEVLSNYYAYDQEAGRRQESWRLK